MGRLTRSDSEIVGFLIKSPVRGAIAVTLIDTGPLDEAQIAEHVLGKISRLREDPMIAEFAKRAPGAVTAAYSDVVRGLSEMVDAGLLEQSAKGYKIVVRARKALESAMAPLSRTPTG